MKMADDWGKHMEMTYPNGDIMDAMQIFYEIHLSKATGNTIPKITIFYWVETINPYGLSLLYHHCYGLL